VTDDGMFIDYIRDLSKGLKSGAGSFPIKREKISLTLGLDYKNGD
jgi:hypothetical protein